MDCAAFRWPRPQGWAVSHPHINAYRFSDTAAPPACPPPPAAGPALAPPPPRPPHRRRRPSGVTSKSKRSRTAGPAPPAPAGRDPITAGAGPRTPLAALFRSVRVSGWRSGSRGSWCPGGAEAADAVHSARRGGLDAGGRGSWLGDRRPGRSVLRGPSLGRWRRWSRGSIPRSGMPPSVGVLSWIRAWNTGPGAASVGCRRRASQRMRPPAAARQRCCGRIAG
jgi:hypothetical protein